MENDSDGVYEAHIVTSAGQQLIVQVGKDFAVTGTDTPRGRKAASGEPIWSTTSVRYPLRDESEIHR